MADKLPNSRTSRTRQAIAIIAWICLVGTAFLLWNARQTGLLRQSTDPGSASFLAAFAAFVSVFAWMLFNPQQTRTSDSLSLFAAFAATLVPPPLIAFSLISSNSPLRWWVALGIFVLLVIAVLSHVPDEFFGVPRGRSSYVMPLPVFDRVENSVMDPNASWFKFNDLRDVVDDRTRPSLAPRAYLQSEQVTSDASGAAAATYTPARPVSEVDDILGSDFDLGLLDDPMLEMDLRETMLDPYVPESATPVADRPDGRSTHRPSRASAATQRPSQPLPTSYPDGPVSAYQRQRMQDRKSALRRPSALNRPSRQARFAASLRPAAADEQPPSTTFPRPTPASAPPPIAPPSSVPATARSRRPAADPLDETPLQQREDAAKGHPPEYLQQTNRDRGQRHRARRTTSAPLTDAADAPPTSGEPSAGGRSIFGIPLPFGRTAEPPTDETPEESSQQTRSTSAAGSSTSRQQTARSTTRRSARQSTSRQSAPTESAATAATRSTQEHSRERSAAASPEISSKTSAVERTQDAQGGELVEGVMTVRFDKGQKRANLHIPFSPPLAGMPEVECECVDDVPVRLKVPVRQSYGIRIEARRSDASEALEADVGFAAMYSPEG